MCARSKQHADNACGEDLRRPAAASSSRSCCRGGSTPATPLSPIPTVFLLTSVNEGKQAERYGARYRHCFNGTRIREAMCHAEHDDDGARLIVGCRSTVCEPCRAKHEEHRG